MRTSFHEGLAKKNHFISSYDSIDDVYLVEQEEDKQSDGQDSSSSKKVISRKLVFSEYMIGSPSTPGFTCQNEFSQAYLQQKEQFVLSINQQQSSSKQYASIIKSPEKKQSQKRVDFCLQSKENTILPFQKRQNEYLSSDKQLKIMKQAIRNTHGNTNNGQNRYGDYDNQQNQVSQNNQAQPNNPTENPPLILNEIGYTPCEQIQNTNCNDQIVSEIENQIHIRLSELYNEYCNKIDRIKIERFQKDTLLNGLCSREYMKYNSLQERSKQMTLKVNKICQSK